MWGMRSLLLIVALLLAGCSKQPVNHEPIRKYHIDGEIVRLDPDTQSAVIRHKDIEGWMKAMTMDYPFRSKEDYAKLHPGDHITGTVFVQGDDFWVGEIQKAP
jgi:Cu/Ag efflux protein CusF